MINFWCSADKDPMYRKKNNLSVWNSSCISNTTISLHSGCWLLRCCKFSQLNRCVRYVRCGCVPSSSRSVIFFRDRVSEGEYNTVTTADLEAIRGKFLFCLTYRTIRTFFNFLILHSCHQRPSLGSGYYQILEIFIVVGVSFIGVSILTNTVTVFDLLATTPS